MKLRPRAIYLLIYFCCIYQSASCLDHDIIFCGERIPVDNDFVSKQLMNVIRRQIPNVNLPQLRKRAAENFPLVERYLQGTGLPEDLKYLAIVESGFQNLTSNAGARGFWQLMPPTARERGLIVSDFVDERDDIRKSTYAACKELARNYMLIRKNYGISSWVLTAAAYNVGIGRMFKTMNSQGKDYFSMNLNAETALYVYKIIAVKELFEYPELYMKDFGYNVFKSITPPSKINLQNSQVDENVFKSMEVKVDLGDGQHPDSVSAKETINENISNEQLKKTEEQKPKKFTYIAANIKGKYKNFSDGQLISIELQDDLFVKGIFNLKGNIITGTGWMIDDRIFIDLGYEDHDIVLLSNGKKGVEPTELKNDEPILLRIQDEEDL